MIRHIPNTLTLLNLVSGFAATVYAIKGYNEYATFCIMAGMVLDFSDGFAARLLKAYSDIGKDLDSLADVVTFGVAPGAIMLNLLTVRGFLSRTCVCRGSPHSCCLGTEAGKIQQ